MPYGFFFKFILAFSLIIKFILFNVNTKLEASTLEEKIKRHIQVLAVELGERNYLQYKNLESAANYIRQEFKSYGYEPAEQVYTMENRPYRNIIAIKPGKDKKDKIIIICAHYDSVLGSPGADDNASGVAALLELARLFSQLDLNKTLKFIAFTNEEPPFYLTEYMGSFRYAKEAKKRRENIEAVLCLESIGFYSDNKSSQSYPFGLSLFYPDKANFIAVVSNLSSGYLLKRIVGEFKKASNFPVEYLIAPIFLAEAISFSDHWSFWEFGYRAVVVTDTAFYRNPYYHTPQDTPGNINYKNMLEVIRGLYKVVLNLSE